MFNCDGCKSSIGPGIRPIRIPTERRQREYPIRVDINNKVIDRGGVGWEIVRESNFCVNCQLLFAHSEVLHEV